jgi:hypothetical protein
LAAAVAGEESVTGGSRRAQAVTACTAAPLLLWALLITWPARMPVPDHAVSGIVTAVAPTRLAIRRARRTPPDMTFAVDASTVREGVIAVGARVQVRFRDGHPPVATAILAVRRI